jgi:glycosyltransferase involved in cell wall biosynthesis
MRIINAIFGRKKGGIEQNFADYSRALSDLGHDVTVLTYQDIPSALLSEKVKRETITNFGQWDPLVTWKVKKIIRDIAPDVIITHGNRASYVLNKLNLRIPVVSVLEYYNAKQITECSYVVTTNDELRRTLIKKGLDENNIFMVPDMIYIPDDLKLRNFKWHEPKIIGTMGRFVAKKGINIFLRAIKILRARNYDIRVIIGGAGADAEKLENLAKTLSISDIVSFPGWIEDKAEFFKSIDIFCLSSMHESRGLTLLEAMMNSVPVVSTDTEVALGIIRPGVDGLLADIGDPESLADQLEILLKDPSLADKFTKEGFKTVTTIYDTKMVGSYLENVLNQIVSLYNETNPPQPQQSEVHEMEEETIE